MPAVYPSYAHFRGVPLKQFRNFLKALAAGNFEPGGLGALRDVQMALPTTLAILQETADAGFIKQPAPLREGEWTPPALTETGRTVAAASMKKFLTRERAESLVEEVLDRASALNANGSVEVDVAKVWLFGGLVDPSIGEIGEVEVAVETMRLWDGIEDYRDWTDRLAGASGHPLPAAAGLFFDPAAYVVEQSIIGERRNPYLLSGTVELSAAAGKPCQLVFDRSRGGPVSDPVLPEHPSAAGRRHRKAGDTREVSAELNATIEGMLPLDVRWLATDEHRAYHADKFAFQRYNDCCLMGATRHEAGYTLFIDTVAEENPGLHVDGVRRFLLRPLDERQAYPDFGFIVDRNIDIDGAEAAVSLSISPFGDFPDAASNDIAAHLRSICLLLLTADVQRIDRRLVSQGHNDRLVNIDIETKFTEPFNTRLITALTNPVLRDLILEEDCYEGFTTRVKANGVDLTGLTAFPPSLESPSFRGRSLLFETGLPGR